MFPYELPIFLQPPTAIKQALFNIERTVRTLRTPFNYSDIFDMNFGLRVPNPICVLQGEDTVNFKVKTATIAYNVVNATFIVVVVDIVVDVVGVVVVAVVVV